MATDTAGRVTWKSLKPRSRRLIPRGRHRSGPGRTVIQVFSGSRLMATLPVEVSQPDFVSPKRLVLGRVSQTLFG